MGTHSEQWETNRHESATINDLSARNLMATNRPEVVTNFQGQMSAQGILHLRNPNLDPNSGKQILGARSLDPNFWVEFFEPFFVPAKEAPRKIHHQEIHLSKFTFQTSTQKSGQKIHIAPLQGLLTDKFQSGPQNT